ncbi:MAG: penicillin-binding protein activator [Candidatus Thiodiazotropha taylori]|nr:penicillin-binding protein activator [Candidatus Thiodiazotropha taylori]
MHIIRHFALLLIFVLLFQQGCTTVTKEPLPAQQMSPELRLQVTALLEDEDYATAAMIVESYAMESQPPFRDQLLLEAVEYWLKAGEQERSLALVKLIRPSETDEDFNLKLRMLKTELAVLQGDIDQALDLMQPEPGPDAPIELRQHYHRNMAEIFRLSGNLLESARELDVLDPLMQADEDQRLAIQELLVQTLTTMTDTALTLLQPQPPSTLIGWMELAKVIKSQTADPEELSNSLAEWRQRFPDHPAMQTLMAGLLELQGLSPDDHIAIMLPRSGPYAKVAAAVRDGLMAAWYQQPPQYRPKLQFYDSSELQSTLTIYQQAVLNGAQMIVGPLNKDSVKMVSNLELLDIPVLALNQVEDELYETNPNLFQFGLAPEDEAEQVAERAWLEGHRTALLLTPQGNWGDRLANSFRNRWLTLGGEIMESQTYLPKENDFSVPIRMLLNINESEARIRSLTRLMGQKFESEPRTRQDADFIFLAARPQKARQIRPQLKFFRAGNLPILSTSHIYSGIEQAELDRDLGKISFVDTPWLLEDNHGGALSRKSLERFMPGVKGRYARLYAMGIDSYNLLSQLQAMQEQPGRLYNGKSGTIYLDAQNRMHRLLAWADMEKGKASIIGYAPRIEMPHNNQSIDDINSIDELDLDPQADRPEAIESGLPPVSDHDLSEPASQR